jgi:hypothetical protein
MIDNPPTYHENSIMQEIREKYGTERTTLEGTSEATGIVQDGIRPGESESGQSGGVDSGREDQVGRKLRKARRDAGIARGSYKRKGRANTTPSQVSSGVNRSYRSTDREIQLNERESVPSFVAKEDYAKEEDKPAGLGTKPHAKERKIREEQERAAAAARESATESPPAENFFAWLRPNNNRKTGKDTKEKPGIRNKPLSQKEADEIREPLISAMGDYFHYADELMTGTSANGAEAAIWGSIDDEEIGILIDAWLARARTDSRAAYFAVQAVNGHYKLKIGLILAPRFYQTFQFYVDNGMRSPMPNVRRRQRGKQRRPLSVVQN